MSIAEKVHEALERGEMLPEFMEENRLLPTTHDAAKKFSATMERAHDRLLTGLLGENYPKAEHAVQFMLSVDESPNAFNRYPCQAPGHRLHHRFGKPL